MPIDEIQLNFNPEAMWLLNTILAIIMFGVALDLKTDDFKRVISTPKGPIIGLLAQFVLLPAFTYLLTLIINPTPSIALGMILIAACPGGNMSNFITHLAKGNTALSVSMTAISTISAVVMTPLNLSFWGNLNPQTAKLLTLVNLDPFKVLLTVLLILGVPLAAGMVCAKKFPEFSEKLKNPFKLFSVIALMLFIVIAFGSNYDIFTHYIGWVALAVFVHNATALSTGYSAGRLFRLPHSDSKAIAIEVGIQNSALGLAIIFTFFSGLGGMAIVAGAWGIWHIISGLSLAFFWNRSAVRAKKTVPNTF